jgi:hypothetical protein
VAEDKLEFGDSSSGAIEVMSQVYLIGKCKYSRSEYHDNIEETS